jgi:hypothetical protein
VTINDGGGTCVEDVGVDARDSDILIQGTTANTEIGRLHKRNKRAIQQTGKRW